MEIADSEINSFIEYFCTGMAKTFESIRKNIVSSLKNKDRATDKSDLLYHLDERQKHALDLFLKQKIYAEKYSQLIPSPLLRMNSYEQSKDQQHVRQK